MDNDILFKIKELDHYIIKIIRKKSSINCNNKPTRTQIMFIKYLIKHEKDAVTAKDLEDYFNLTKATVSDVLNTMEKHKMIIRVTKSTDTRVKNIILNEEIKEEHKKIQKEFIKINEIITKNINNNDLLVFNNVVSLMIKNIDNYMK